MTENATVQTVETWKPVVGYEGLYEVSDCGRVRNINPVPTSRPGGLLVPSPHRQGYLLVAITDRKGRRRTYYVHRLVAAAFIGSGQKGLEINHRNAIKADNRLENLELITHRDNIRHAWAMGLCRARMGESCNTAVLTEAKVCEIRSLSPAMKYREIAALFGVSKGCVHRVVTRQTWKHLLPAPAPTPLAPSLSPAMEAA